MESTLVFEIKRNILLFGKYKVELMEVANFRGNLRRSFPYHCHTFYELALVMHGTTSYTVNGSEFACSDGQLVLVSPECLHAVWNRDISPEDSIWSIRLRIDPDSDLAKELRGKAVLVDLHHKMPFLQALLDQWLELDQQSAHAADYMLPFSNLLLHIIFEELEKSRSEYADRSDPYYREILKYLMAHYHEHLSLDDLAARFAVSKSHLMRCFKQNFNITPMHYCTELLINESCVYLDSSKHTVKEISERLDFDSVNYYVRTFEKYMGYTPTEYRRLFLQVREVLPGEPSEASVWEYDSFLFPTVVP